MSRNDFERKIEFLAQQQVRSAAETQALRESLLSLTMRTDSLAAIVEGLGRKFDAFIEVQADQHMRLSRVEDSFVLLVQMAKLTDQRLDAFENRSNYFEGQFSEIDARLITLSEHMTALASAHSHTDERLNTLMDVVERYITHDGGNAK